MVHFGIFTSVKTEKKAFPFPFNSKEGNLDASPWEMKPTQTCAASFSLSCWTAFSRCFVAISWMSSYPWQSFKASSIFEWNQSTLFATLKNFCWRQQPQQNALLRKIVFPESRRRQVHATAFRLCEMMKPLLVPMVLKLGFCSNDRETRNCDRGVSRVFAFSASLN